MKRMRELDGKVMKTFVWVGLVLQQVFIWFSLVGPFPKQVIRMTLPRVWSLPLISIFFSEACYLIEVNSFNDFGLR